MSLFVPKDRRSLFRQFLTGMYDAVIIADPNGHILDVNPRAVEHFGRDLDEVLDQPVSTLIPGLRPEVVQRIRHGIEGDHRVMVNAYGVNKAGAKFACEVTVSVIDLMNPGDHGSTFGGNALAMAAARATVETMIDERIGEHVIETGAHMRERLAALPHVTEVRGHGLMLGAQFDVPIATPLVTDGLSQGLVLNHIRDYILRFLPPLVVTTAQVDEMADKLEGLIVALA